MGNIGAITLPLTPSCARFEMSNVFCSAPISLCSCTPERRGHYTPTHFLLCALCNVQRPLFCPHFLCSCAAARKPPPHCCRGDCNHHTRVVLSTGVRARVRLTVAVQETVAPAAAAVTAAVIAATFTVMTVAAPKTAAAATFTAMTVAAQKTAAAATFTVTTVAAAAVAADTQMPVAAIMPYHMIVAGHPFLCLPLD